MRKGGAFGQVVLTVLVSLVLVVSVFFGLSKYSQYRCGSGEFLGLDFRCHAEFDVVRFPPTASTACSENQVLTGGNRCVALNESIG